MPAIRSPLRPAIRAPLRSPLAPALGGSPSLTAQVQALFAASEPGAWYDPSDMSTMYQDAAGTTPCYQPGQGQVDPPVGRILDKSGRGNHATQPTTTCRPTLSARYNLLTGTEFANGLTDAPTQQGLVSATALAGYAGAIAFGHDGTATSYAYKNGSGSYPLATVSVVVRMNDGSAPMFGAGTKNSNTDFELVIRGATIDPSTYLVTPLPNGCYRVTGSRVATAGSSNVGVVKYNTNSPRTFKVTAFDLRPANDGVGLPPYQRVVDANTYDTDGFPLYLKFDGADDALQTGNINFTSTDKMTVWAGFNKSSDAAVGYLLSMGASGGRLDIRAPSTAGSNISTNAISSAGASVFASTLATGYAANMGISYSATVDFAAAAGSECTSRVNGVAVPQNGGLTQENTGVFGSQILTIGQFVGASHFNGRLYQLIVRGAQSSLSQLEAGELLTRSRMKLP